MFCRQCGTKLPDDSLFCNSCGTRVAPLEASVPQPQAPPRPVGTFDSTQLLRTTGTGPNDPPAIAGSSPQYPAGATSFPQYPGSPTAQSVPISSPQYASAPFMPTSSPSYPSYPSVSPTSNPQYPPYPEAYPGSNFPYSSYPPTGQSSTIPAPHRQAVVMPQSSTQRWLVQIVGPTLATNPLFGVILGSIVAAVTGVLSCGVFLAIAHAIAPHLGNASYPWAGEDLIDYSIGIVPLHDLFRDSLQFYIVIQGAGIHYVYTNSNSFSNTSYIAPFSALLIIPAFFLVMGGYIAASTDFQQNMRSSLWRGMLLAIPYAILLFLSSLAVNGCVPTSGPNGVEVCSTVVTSTASAYTMSIDTATLLFFGVLWGALFGLLGATLKVAQGHWRQSLFRLLHTTNRPQMAGMLVGGLASASLAIVLAIATLFSFMAYSSYSVPLVYQATCVVTQNWQSVMLWSLSQGPFYAIDLLLFALGAPITVSNPQANQCFYIHGTHASFSLFGTTPPLSPWLHLLLAIPILSLFLGGRVSAAWGRVRGPGAGTVQGALAAAPFAAVMLLLVPLSSITSTVTLSDGTNGSQTVTQMMSAGAFEVILWVLLGGAVIAGLGGLYQVSPLQPAVSHIFRALALPFRAVAAPLYLLLDRISRLPRGSQRSSTRSMIYAALLWMILLAIIAAVGGGILVGFNQTITYAVNLRVRDILSTALVAAPCLLIIIACATALRRDPSSGALAAPVAPNPVTPPVPSYYGPSMPGGRL
ncbi:MAG: zinc-ribbon domain-containing protein [Ktedonobacteraceae bacterium]